jgi:hypothetical protein
MSGYVQTPGYQRVILRGYMLKEKHDGLYATQLHPSMFYGASGEPLQTWRQQIDQTGHQTLLYRTPGNPSIVFNDYNWRKIADKPNQQAQEPRYYPSREIIREPTLHPVIVFLLLLAGAGIIFLGLRGD